MIAVYVETNFLISYAKNQDQEIGDLLTHARTDQPDESSPVKIILPSFCCMESLSVLEDERRRRNYFKDSLYKEISELRNNVKSAEATAIRKHLQAASEDNDKMLNDIEARLIHVLEWISNHAELIQMSSSLLQESISSSLIEDPTDNLILHCILSHAKQFPTARKALLSGSSKDFGTVEVKQPLQAAGIEKYVAKTKDFLGWLNSL